MRSLAEVAQVLSNAENRSAFREAVEKTAIESRIDEYITGLDEEQIEAALKEAQEVNSEKQSKETAEKVAADYYAAGQVMAAGFQDSMSEVFGKQAEQAEKLEKLLSVFEAAGVFEE